MRGVQQTFASAVRTGKDAAETVARNAQAVAFKVQGSTKGAAFDTKNAGRTMNQSESSFFEF